MQTDWGQLVDNLLMSCLFAIATLAFFLALVCWKHRK
jgi:hypothetical protein